MHVFGQREEGRTAGENLREHRAEHTHRICAHSNNRPPLRLAGLKFPSSSLRCRMGSRSGWGQYGPVHRPTAALSVSHSSTAELNYFIQVPCNLMFPLLWQKTFIVNVVLANLPAGHGTPIIPRFLTPRFHNIVHPVYYLAKPWHKPHFGVLHYP